MDVSIWMILGLLLAGYSVVANDSLKTLGTYSCPNRNFKLNPLLMLFICTLTCVRPR